MVPSVNWTILAQRLWQTSLQVRLSRLPVSNFRSYGSVSKDMVRLVPGAHDPLALKSPQKNAMLPLRKALEKINSQYPHVYAKLLIHNFPFTVTRTDLLVTHRMRDVQVGDVIELDEVREVGSTDYKLRGTPLIPKGAVRVHAVVMEHTEGAKKRARMRRQRKGRRPMRTIKPLITTLRIQDIFINQTFTAPICAKL